MAASAFLTWDPSAGATSYKVEYKLASDPTWTLFNAAVATTNVTITNLNEGTNYDFRITSNCSTGSSGGVSITGATPCKDVTSLQGSFAGTTANLSWDKKPHGVQYVIEYKLQSSGTWTAATGSPLNNSGQPDPVLFSISGLAAGEAYDFRVQVACSVGTSTGAVISITSACPSATNLGVTFS